MKKRIKFTEVKRKARIEHNKKETAEKGSI